MPPSRRRSREFLLESLYSQVSNGNVYDRDVFFSCFFEPEMRDKLDFEYIDAMEDGIRAKQTKLLDMIAHFAPKFDLKTMPVLHLLILMIALYEILFLNDPSVSPKISMNEAVELAKTFSDDHGRIFVNGVLAKYMKTSSHDSEIPENEFRIL